MFYGQIALYLVSFNTHKISSHIAQIFYVTLFFFFRKEAERLANEQLRDKDEGNFLRDQPLDMETDRVRRELGRSMGETQRAIAHVQVRLRLVFRLFETRKKERARISYPFGPPRRPPNRSLDCNKVLFDSLMSGYDRTTQLSNKAGDLEKKANEIMKSLSPTYTSSSVRSSGKKVRHRGVSGRIIPLPVSFTSPAARQKAPLVARSSDSEGVTKRQTAVEDEIRRLAQNCIKPKNFTRRGLIMSGSSQFRNIQTHDWRSRDAASQLMSSAAAPQSNVGTVMTTPSSKPSQPRSLFVSPTSLAKGRSEWDERTGVDQAKLSAMSLSLPSSVKKVDSLGAARKALHSFGTTPEQTTKAQEVKMRKPVEATVAAASSTSDFPPMAPIAPKPFSRSSSSTTTKTTTKKAVFPPLASKAPTPFSGAKSSNKGQADISDKMATATMKGTKQGIVESSSFSLGKATKSSVTKDAKYTSSKTEDGKDGFAFGEKFGTALGTENSPGSRKEQFGSGEPHSKSPMDYEAILTSFYQTHDPSKIGSVGKILTKYKGHEDAMFAK